MLTLSKARKYKKQNDLIIKYAAIIAECTKLPYDSDEVQDAALAIYIAVHGKPVRLGP